MIYRNVTKDELAAIVALAVKAALEQEGGAAAASEAGSPGAVSAGAGIAAQASISGLPAKAASAGAGEGISPAVSGGERQVPVGISMRHVHLNRADLNRLFGPTYMLTPMRKLSQPGQFAARECVDVIGPKGTLKNVRILGPLRRETQIELAQTDCRTVGVKAPVRPSGKLEGTPGIRLKGPYGEIEVERGVIVADRHIHLSPSQARAYGLEDGDHVSVQIDGTKRGVLSGVLIRAGSGNEMDFHLDTDDGNAFQLKQGQLVRILGKED